VGGVEWMLAIAGVFVAAVDGTGLGNFRRGGSARILRYGEQERACSKAELRGQRTIGWK
jgi:hypothetical protein